MVKSKEEQCGRVQPAPHSASPQVWSSCPTWPHEPGPGSESFHLLPGQNTTQHNHHETRSGSESVTYRPTTVSCQSWKCIFASILQKKKYKHKKYVGRKKTRTLDGIKPTVSCETLSAIWLVWWRKRRVETSPSAAKHLKKKHSGAQRSNAKKKTGLSMKKPVNRSVFRLEKLKKNPPER